MVQHSAKSELSALGLHRPCTRNEIIDDFNRDEISGMRKIEVITLFNANNLPSAKQLTLGQLQASLLGSRLTAVLAMSNNSLTNSLTHSLTHSKARAIEKAHAPALIYGFSCKRQPMKQREKSQACLCSSESLPMIFTKLIKLKNVYTENYPACTFLIALRTSWFSS